jgi:hypothetical protein
VSRVAVFLDWQNCYQQARVAFDLKAEPNKRGVFNPFELAHILVFGNRRGDEGGLGTRLQPDVGDRPGATVVGSAL